MPLPSITRKSAVSNLLGAVARTIFFTAALGLLALVILLSPTILNFVDDDRLDWGRLADIGQAYGPVSALLSALALCVVVFVQRRQQRQERVLMVREMHAGALRTAMEDPVYGQCWGPRVTPDHIDERLFYYTSTILTAWMYAWECGDLNDGAARAYVRAMAGSEVSREYWQMHGTWRLRAARGRRRRFLNMVDAEFRAAVAAGPPARTLERSSDQRGADRGCVAASPCCRRRPRRPHLGQITDRTMRMNARH